MRNVSGVWYFTRWFVNNVPQSTSLSFLQFRWTEIPVSLVYGYSLFNIPRIPLGCFHACKGMVLCAPNCPWNVTPPYLLEVGERGSQLYSRTATVWIPPTSSWLLSASQRPAKHQRTQTKETRCCGSSSVSMGVIHIWRRPA